MLQPASAVYVYVFHLKMLLVYTVHCTVYNVYCTYINYNYSGRWRFEKRANLAGIHLKFVWHQIMFNYFIGLYRCALCVARCALCVCNFLHTIHITLFIVHFLLNAILWVNIHTTYKVSRESLMKIIIIFAYCIHYRILYE